MHIEQGEPHGGKYNQVQNMFYVLEAHTRGSMGMLGGVVSKHKLLFFDLKEESSL